PLPGSDENALLAPRNILSLILSRWPRNLSQGPAGEMWSVVVFPLVLINRGSFSKSLPSQRGKGCNSCSRSLVGGTSTVKPSPLAAGATNPSSPLAKPLAGSSSPCGGCNLNSLPSAPFSV